MSLCIKSLSIVLFFPYTTTVTISPLQCYSVLSTIAQVLRKMSLKILVSWFWCFIYFIPLNHTRGLNIFIQCKWPWFEEIFTVIWNLWAFYSLQIEYYSLKIASCVQCYSVLYVHMAYYSVYVVNSYTILNRKDYLYLKVAYSVICLA